MSAVPKIGGPSQKVQPYRKLAYRQHVARQPCIACGRTDTQAAHISVGNYARGMKADDWYCIPLCAPRFVENGCHAEFDAGQERFARERLGLSINELKATAKAKWRAWASIASDSDTGGSNVG